MGTKSLALVGLAFILSCTPSEPITFQLEPKHKYTFRAKLHRGDLLRISATGLESTQQLRFHHCGPKCNTAESVDSWDPLQFSKQPNVTIRIGSDGEYYFWVEDISRKRHTKESAVAAVSAVNAAGSTTVRYPKDLVIVVQVTQSNSMSNGRAANAAQVK